MNSKQAISKPAQEKLVQYLAESAKTISTDPEVKIARAKQAIELAQELGDQGSEAQAYQNLSYIYFGQDLNIAETYTQQALTIYQSQKLEAETGRMILNLGILNMQLRNLDQALSYFSIALKTAEQQHNKELRLKIIKNIGLVYYWKGDFRKALILYQEVQSSLDKNSDDYPGLLEQIGAVYQRLNEWNHAIEILLAALKIREKEADNQKLAISYNHLGATYATYQQPDKAMEFYQKALDHSRNSDDEDGTAIALNNIANLYENDHKHEQALDYYEQALKISLSIKDELTATNIRLNIINLQAGKGDYIAAIDNQQLVLKAYRKMGTNLDIPAALNSISYFYLELKDYSNALKYAKKSVTHTQEMEDKQELLRCYQLLADIYEKTKKYQHSVKYLQLHAKLNAELYEIESNKNIAEMQTRFETEKKELQINHLELELEMREKELLLQATHMVNKNEFLVSLYKQMNVQASSDAGLRCILMATRKALKSELNSQQDWQEFESWFLKVNENFFQRLAADYPDLTVIEIKILSLLKLGLSSKEIARIMVVDPGSIFKSRYRIRKKMGLTKAIKLEQLLKDY